MLGRRSRNCDTVDLEEMPAQFNCLKTRKLQDQDLQQFKVDPLRYDKNKLDFLPPMQINKYLGLPIRIETVRKQLFGPVRSACWTPDDLRVFLEKYFVYQRDFKRITEFLPVKTCKDAVDLFYMIKKSCNLKMIEKELDECVGSKIQLIYAKVSYLISEVFKIVDDGSISGFSI